VTTHSIQIGALRCVVLGASGFLGRNLCEYLYSCGVAVKAFSRSRIPGAENDRYIWILGDFRNECRVAEAIRGADVVFHLVGATTPGSSNQDVLADAEANLVPSIRFLQSCVREGVKRVVFVSSGGTVYGEPQATPIPEDHPTDPLCAYGISKLAVEKYLALYERLSGLVGIALRVSNPYGPYQTGANGQGVIGTFIAKSLAGEVLEIWGDGTVVRDYIFVRDVVEALVIAATYDGPARVFNIGSGIGVSINEIVSAVGKATDSSPRVSYRSRRSVDVCKSVLDCRLAERELGWVCKTPLTEGISASVQWYRERDGLSRNHRDVSSFCSSKQEFENGNA